MSQLSTFKFRFLSLNILPHHCLQHLSHHPTHIIKAALNLFACHQHCFQRRPATFKGRSTKTSGYAATRKHRQIPSHSVSNSTRKMQGVLENCNGTSRNNLGRSGNIRIVSKQQGLGIWLTVQVVDWASKYGRSDIRGQLSTLPTR